jgi:glutathione synthase/RimK-type ligase-like ATP-grasp enzyme
VLSVAQVRLTRGYSKGVRQIALVTYAGYPDLTDDDRMLVPALRRLKVDAVPVMWDAPVTWTQFDQVIIRSCWDYHLRAADFLRWVERLENSRVSLHNSPRLVRWNADKRYLRDLQEAGVRIPPTMWLESGEEVDTHRILKSNGWESAVVKPTIGASAHGLRRISAGEPASRLAGPAMVQQYVPEVADSGEWSLVFFQGEFSHAALKLPASGDFRVQAEYGGTATRAEPGRKVMEAARSIMEALPEQPLYARIDGIEDDQGFALMEAELIEPALFLELGGAVTRFAEIVAAMRQSSDSMRS